MTDHLSELMVNRYVLGDSPAAEAVAIEQHVGTCARCAEYVEAVRAFDGALVLPAFAPPTTSPAARPTSPHSHPAAQPLQADSERRPASVYRPPSPPPHPPRTSRDTGKPRWARRMAAGLVLGAASFLLLRLVAVPGEDDVRAKGGEFALEVFAKGADRPREVGDGDVVHPGERLGFRVRSDGGFVLIAGVDDAGEAYPCFPPHGTAEKMDFTQDPVVVNGAVELDGKLGTERIVALQCADLFAFEDLVTTLQADAGAPLPLLRSGCAQREIVLQKRARLSP